MSQPLDRVLATKFVTEDGEVSITVPQAGHALHHFGHMLYLVQTVTDAEAAMAGIMAACLGHVFGWEREYGKAQLATNEGFQKLVDVMIGLHFYLEVEDMVKQYRAERS